MGTTTVPINHHKNQGAENLYGTYERLQQNVAGGRNIDSSDMKDHPKNSKRESLEDKMRFSTHRLDFNMEEEEKKILEEY